MKRIYAGVCMIAASLLLVACINPAHGDHLADARNYLEKGDLRAAMIELKKALLQDPANAQARWLLGRTSLQMRDAPAAAKELQRARELGVVDKLVLPYLARALLMQGRNEDLLALDTRTLTGNTMVEVAAAKGLALLALGRQDEAEQRFDLALELDPGSPYALVAKARLLVARREFGEARTVLEKALSTDEKFRPAWGLLGDIERLEGHAAKAEAAYGKAVEGDTYDTVDRLKLVLMQIQLKKYDQAQREIDQLNKQAPGTPGFDYAQGMLYLDQEKIAAAQESFESALSSNDRYLPAMFLLAVAHYQQRHMGLAEAYISRFAASNPGSAEGRELYAMIRLETGEYEAAEELLRPVVQARDDDVLALNLLADALLLQGKTEEGIAVLAKVNAISPDSAEAKLRLGLGLLIQGERTSSVDQLESAIAVSPQYRQAGVLLIWKYLRQSDYEKAIAAAEAYRDRFPAKAAPCNMLGLVNVAKNDEAAAKRAFSKALDMAPGDPMASYQLAALALRNKDLAAARAYYKGVLKHHEGHLSTLLKLAELAAAENDERGMIDILEQALAAHPEAVKPRVVLAKYYLTKGQPERVPSVIGPYEVQTADPEILSVMAASQLAEKKMEDARETLQQLLRRRPNAALAHYMLARAYAGLDDRERVRSELTKAVELEPNLFVARLALARLLWSEGDKAAVSEQLALLKKAARDHPDVLRLEASIARAQGNQQKALDLYERVFEQAATTSSMLRLARQRWGMDDRAGTISLLEDWVQESPADLEARLALANAYASANRLPEAIAQYQRVRQLDANNIGALNELAWNLRNTDPQQALEYAQRARELAPNSPAVLDTLAMVLLDNDQLERARRSIARAAVKSPKNPSIRYHSAMIARAAGDNEAAVRELTQLLDGGERFPEKAEARQLLEQLQTGR